MEKNIESFISEELNSFLDNSFDIVFFKDINLVYRGVSKSFAEFVGKKTSEEIIGHTDFDLFGEEYAKKYTDSDKNMIETQQNMPTYVDELPPKDGKTQWAHKKKFLIWSDGRIIGVGGCARDITEQVYLEKARDDLKEGVNRYSTVLSDVRTSVWDYDFNTKCMIQSPSSVKIHGYNTVIHNVPESLIENGFIHPESAQAYLDMYKKLEEGAEQAEGFFRVKGENDNQYWYEQIRYTALFDKNGKPYRAVGMSQDVTERFEAQLYYDRELRLQMSMSSDMINSIFIDVDLWKVIRYRTSDLFLGQDVSSDVKTPNEFAKLAIEQTIDSEDAKNNYRRFSKDFIYAMYKQGKSGYSFESLRKLPNGKIHWVRNEGRYVVDPTSGHLMLFHALRDIDKEKRQVEALMQAAETDSMTGLLNHKATLERIDRFMLHDGKSGMHALLIVDIDSFKSVNDTFGHQKGDAIIIDVTTAIKTVFRQSDVLGRIGGDEFMVLMKDIESINVLAKKAQELVSALQFHVNVGNDAISVSGSVGISVLRDGNKNFDQLFHEADSALYEAKSQGKNCYSICNNCIIEESVDDNIQIGGLKVTQFSILLKYMKARIFVVEVGKEIKLQYYSDDNYYKKGAEALANDKGFDFLSVYCDDKNIVEKTLRDANDGNVHESAYRKGVLGKEWRHVRATRLPVKSAELDCITVIGVVTDITSIMNSK